MWELSGKRWELIREQAYRRDRKADSPCWICGKPIDYRSPNNPMDKDYSPWAWEPDHYYPHDKYPELTYDLANIRPSHSYCNRARGQKDAVESRYRNQIGKTSREWGIGEEKS